MHDRNEGVATYPDANALQHVSDALLDVTALARHLSEQPCLSLTDRALARSLTNEIEALASLHEAYHPRHCDLPSSCGESQIHADYLALRAAQEEHCAATGDPDEEYARITALEGKILAGDPRDMRDLALQILVQGDHGEACRDAERPFFERVRSLAGVEILQKG